MPFFSALGFAEIRRDSLLIFKLRCRSSDLNFSLSLGFCCSRWIQHFSYLCISSVVNGPLAFVRQQLFMNRDIQQVILINFHKLSFYRSLSQSSSLWWMVILVSKRVLIGFVSFSDSLLAMMFGCGGHCSGCWGHVGPVHHRSCIWFPYTPHLLLGFGCLVHVSS